MEETCMIVPLQEDRPNGGPAGPGASRFSMHEKPRRELTGAAQVARQSVRGEAQALFFFVSGVPGTLVRASRRAARRCLRVAAQRWSARGMPQGGDADVLHRGMGVEPVRDGLLGGGGDERLACSCSGAV